MKKEPVIKTVPLIKLIIEIFSFRNKNVLQIAFHWFFGRTQIVFLDPLLDDKMFFL